MKYYEDFIFDTRSQRFAVKKELKHVPCICPSKVFKM